ncbi:MAG: transcriptional repressor [Clostridia bacterium]|nr:transcriptional repressor [Clostridia bacterium]MBN2882915.1 transcriptional repressor [Clostridia bacterium]
MDSSKTFRYSQQREKILEFVKNTSIHPTADMVYEKLKREIPSISLGTVYRNLHMLAEQGLINKLSTGSGADRFDGDTGGHTHFKCDNCGKIFDIDDNDKTDYPLTEHHITGKYVTYSGMCIDCLENN